MRTIPETTDSLLPAMIQFADSLTLRQAREQFFAENEAVFGKDGGYDQKWVRVELGPIPIYYPNFLGRDRAVRLHDLHHIVTGYSTQLLGEAEIGAWEVASGCGHFWHPWFLNMGAFAMGMLLAPRRMFRAFVRGRRSTNLYHHYEHLDESLLDENVGGMRERLRLTEQQQPVTAGDHVAFWWWAALSAAVAATPWLIGAAVLALLIYLMVR
jgi:hypothetical protein